MEDFINDFSPEDSLILKNEELTIQYLFIKKNDYYKYRVNINKYLHIIPIRIESPVGYILPINLLNIIETKSFFKELSFSIINKEDIIFKDFNI